MNFTEEFKLGNMEFIENRYIFKSSRSELLHSAFKKCLMRQKFTDRSPKWKDVMVL